MKRNKMLLDVQKKIIGNFFVKIVVFFFFCHFSNQTIIWKYSWDRYFRKCDRKYHKMALATDSGKSFLPIVLFQSSSSVSS